MCLGKTYVQGLGSDVTLVLHWCSFIDFIGVIQGLFQGKGDQSQAQGVQLSCRSSAAP